MKTVDVKASGRKIPFLTAGLFLVSAVSAMSFAEPAPHGARSTASQKTEPVQTSPQRPPAAQSKVHSSKVVSPNVVAPNVHQSKPVTGNQDGHSIARPEAPHRGPAVYTAEDEARDVAAYEQEMKGLMEDVEKTIQELQGRSRATGEVDRQINAIDYPLERGLDPRDEETL